MELFIYTVHYTYIYIYTYFYISKKHHSIKFDFKFSKMKIEVLDTLVYKDHNNLVKEFVEKGYKENIIRNQIEKADNL